MYLRNRVYHRITVFVGIVTFVSLAFAGAAGAQTKDRPRVGVGLSFGKGHATATGVAGGVLFPIKDIGVRSLGVVGAASYHHLNEGQVSLAVVGFGGGVRLTRTWSPKLKTFLQGVVGSVQRRESDSGDTFVRTDLVFTFGGGFLIPLNDQVNFMIDADIGIINDSDGHANKGLLLVFGLSMPLGKS